MHQSNVLLGPDCNGLKNGWATDTFPLLVVPCCTFVFDQKVESVTDFLERTAPKRGVRIPEKACKSNKQLVWLQAEWDRLRQPVANKSCSSAEVSTLFNWSWSNMGNQAPARFFYSDPSNFGHSEHFLWIVLPILPVLQDQSQPCPCRTCDNAGFPASVWRPLVWIHTQLAHWSAPARSPVPDLKWQCGSDRFWDLKVKCCFGASKRCIKPARSLV